MTKQKKLIVIGILVLIGASIVLWFLQDELINLCLGNSTYGRGMMGHGNSRMMFGSRNIMFGGMYMWILIILIIIGVFYYKGSSDKISNKNAITTLNNRLANGEISIEEYNELKKEIGE